MNAREQKRLGDEFIKIAQERAPKNFKVIAATRTPDNNQFQVKFGENELSPGLYTDMHFVAIVFHKGEHTVEQGLKKDNCQSITLSSPPNNNKACGSTFGGWFKLYVDLFNDSSTYVTVFGSTDDTSSNGKKRLQDLLISIVK